jgi:hypothetical protein
MTVLDRILIFMHLKKPPAQRIAKVTRYDKAECERALAEAERRLNLTYAGRGISIYANIGDTQISAGHWGKGRVGALTQGGKENQYVILYVDPVTRQEHWEELVHEMAHCVLWSRGRTGHPAEYANRFLHWRDA